MKKQIINILISIIVFISAVSIPTFALALTSDDIDLLQSVGIITASVANQLHKQIDPTYKIPGETSEATSTCASINVNIKYNDKDTESNNNSVSVLQNFLISKNYLSTSATGYFGSATLAAVKKFQTDNNIDSTGYVGVTTRTKINSLNCSATSTSTTPVIANKVDSAAPSISIEARPSEVVSGYPTTLSWTAKNAVDQCKITAKGTDGKTYSSMVDTTGVKSSGTINTDMTYTLLCYNKYGIPATKTISVKIAATATTASATSTYIQAASISSIIPSTGNRGDTVVITGMGFLSKNDVVFDGTKIDTNLILSQSSTSISFKIPEYKYCTASNCAASKEDINIETGGKKIIQVANTNGYSNDFTFTLPSKIVTISGNPDVASYSSKLSVSSVSPSSGKRGDTVVINGTGFSSDSIVLFAGFKVADNLILSKTNSTISFIIPPYQMGCSEPEYETCPKLPIAGTGLIIETGGVKQIYVMNKTTKATSTSISFTLPSERIVY